MKILITGAAGLIGSNLSHSLIKNKHLVVGVDNFIGGYVNNLPISSYFIHEYTNILDTKNLTKAMKQYKPDLIIHCAALAHEGLSVFSPKTITENIYAGTISVASAAIAAGVKYFINTSSMARYGNITPPFTEGMAPNPVDPYGMAKLHAEQQLNLLSDIHGMKVFHMVPHNVGGIGQCFTDPFRNVVSIFTNRIVHDQPIYIYGDGEQKRSFSHVQDCVEAFTTLINKKDNIANKSVFNIGPSDGTEISVNSLAKLVYANFNKEEDIIRLSARPREVKDAWLDTSKAEDILGYKTTKTNYDVIRDTVNWIKKQPKQSFNYHIDLEIINETTPKTWTEELFNK